MAQPVIIIVYYDKRQNIYGMKILCRTICFIKQYTVSLKKFTRFNFVIIGQMLTEFKNIW